MKKKSKNKIVKMDAKMAADLISDMQLGINIIANHGRFSLNKTSLIHEKTMMKKVPAKLWFITLPYDTWKPHKHISIELAIKLYLAGVDKLNKYDYSSLIIKSPTMRELKISKFYKDIIRMFNCSDYKSVFTHIDLPEQSIAFDEYEMKAYVNRFYSNGIKSFNDLTDVLEALRNIILGDYD